MTDPQTSVPPGMEVEDATETLLAAGVGDGLPVVPPTEDRWRRMLEGVDNPDEVFGLVPPLFGELTPSAVAYHCVLAGARPGSLPVVLAAATACLDPRFNLLGVSTTTGTAAVALVVHGPVVRNLGLNTGTNLLGPGCPANATLGRALTLTLAGVGWARPGQTTMATTGQPGRYTFCLGEPPGGAYPTLAVRRGTAEDEDAVTVLAVGGTAEVLPRTDLPAPDDVLDPLAELLAGTALAAGDPARMAGCEQTVIVPPEVAGRLAEQVPTAHGVAAELFARGNEVLRTRTGEPDLVVAAGAGAIAPLVTGGPGVKMLHLPGWIGGSRAVTRPMAPSRFSRAVPRARADPPGTP